MHHLKPPGWASLDPVHHKRVIVLANVKERAVEIRTGRPGDGDIFGLTPAGARELALGILAAADAAEGKG